jgi:hypothetical protein
MTFGSPEHKAQVCQDLIKTYHENIWKDEIYLMQLEEVRGDKRKQIASIDLELEGRQESSKEDKKARQQAEKAKFIAERELAQIEQEISKISEQVTATWPARIELVKRYMEEKSA